MFRKLVQEYVESFGADNAVKSIDVNTNTVEYQGIKQNRVITDCSGDEEVVRAYILSKLVNELGYKKECIEIENEYTAGRPHTNTSRIDVIVRDENNNAFLFIELKSPSDYATIDKDEVIEEQLYKVAGMERTEGNDVKYLVLYTVAEDEGALVEQCIIIDSKQFKTFADWSAARNSKDTLPSNYGKALKKPYIKNSHKDLRTDFSLGMLSQLEKDLHRVLWGGGGTDDNDIFVSLTNLILSKIKDEDEKEDGEQYDFQLLTYEKDGEEEFETNEQLFERINSLYRRALKDKLFILDESELEKSYVVDTKKFSLAKLKYTVQQLEGISFVDGKNSLDGKDILGTFFENIIRNEFKQSKGQFFTHENICTFMLWAIQADRLAIRRINKDKELPYMIDPSAGSGTFLISYMKFITQNMKYRFRNKLSSSRDVQDHINSDWFYPDHRENKWAQTYIYGTEINFNLGTATKVNMILHGDGSTNIFVKDGLLPFDSYLKETAPNALRVYSVDKLYADNEVNGQFDLILTNPPFSVELENDTKKLLKKEFIFGDKKNSENLFIERWYQLLKEHGRVGAVLPESVFDTGENKYIRIFLYKYFNIKAVVSLPQKAFEPYTSTKTSILFAQKKTKSEIEKWNSEWNKSSKEYSSLRTRVQNIIAVNKGEKDKKSLPSIKQLNESEELALLIHFVDNCFTLATEDYELSVDEFINKYKDEIENLLSYDNDLVDTFGYVNTWWVFGEVSKSINYEVIMAGAEQIGYKRTKRGEKITRNELYRVDDDGQVIVDDGKTESILDYMRLVEWD